ncbi:MAG: hypothetical protein WC829_17885, partial [Hyphomicrobium sp.]
MLRPSIELGKIHRLKIAATEPAPRPLARPRYGHGPHTYPGRRTGMSPIEAAAVAIDIHNEASAWNKALLDNS